MHKFWLLFLLTAAVGWAPADPANVSSAPNGLSAADQVSDGQASTSASGVTPDTPVLTISGLCSQPGTSSAGGSNSECRTIVTRAQFERLVEVLKADKDPQSKQQLATAYPQLLVLAHEAEERGLDKLQRVQERLSFARLQILSQELVGRIQDEAAQVPEKEIEYYYDQNAGEFEQVSLERIVIPNRMQPKRDRQGAMQGNQTEGAMGDLAEALRARAASGEDFTKLQKEAYDAAGLSGNTEPNPRMEALRRRGLPPAHASVFDLKPGQVSQVISDATGHYIYKLESRKIEPLEAARAEISNTLRRQRLQNMIQRVEQPFTTDVNHVYFGAEAKADDD